VIEILDRGNTYHPTEFVSLSFVVLLFYYSLTARIACYWYADLAPFILVMGGFSHSGLRIHASAAYILDLQLCNLCSAIGCVQDFYCLGIYVRSSNR